MSDNLQHSGVSQSKDTSIIKMVFHVMRQVNYQYFADWRSKQVDPFYKELCLIIAEVLVLDPDSSVKINGSVMCARLVQEIYSQLNNDHVSLVYENFHNVSTRVYNKKAYLRTALYNAVFELRANSVNDRFL